MFRSIESTIMQASQLQRREVLTAQASGRSRGGVAEERMRGCKNWRSPNNMAERQRRNDEGGF